MPESRNRLIDYEDFVKYIGVKIHKEAPKSRKTICYARVSSSHQKEDLERQIDLLRSKYPTYEVIKDVGSGLDWKRKGLLSLLELVLSDVVEQVVVTHSDRLSRFSFDLLQWLFKKHNCSILVLNQVTDATPEVELAEDVLSIINYFTAKNNGRRSATNRKNRNNEIKESKTLPEPGTTENIETVVWCQ
jgi:predicted site-specific integrase-resolvase